MRQDPKAHDGTHTKLASNVCPAALVLTKHRCHATMHNVILVMISYDKLCVVPHDLYVAPWQSCGGRERHGNKSKLRVEEDTIQIPTPKFQALECAMTSKWSRLRKNMEHIKLRGKLPNRNGKFPHDHTHGQRDPMPMQSGRMRKHTKHSRDC